MDLHIPTIEEVYKIVYIVQRGWELDSDSNTWGKEGYSLNIFPNRENKKRFSLEDAYWLEKNERS